MTNIRPRVSPEGRYSFTETAELLGVDRCTIYRWRKQGYLPQTAPRKVNHRPVILGKHILRIFDAMC